MRLLLKIRSSWDYLGISEIFLRNPGNSWSGFLLLGIYSLWPFRWIFSRDYFSCSEWWRDVDNWLGQHFFKNSPMGFLLCNNKLMQKYLFGIFNLLEPPLKWVFLKFAWIAQVYVYKVCISLLLIIEKTKLSWNHLLTSPVDITCSIRWIWDKWLEQRFSWIVQWFIFTIFKVNFNAQLFLFLYFFYRAQEE